MENKMSKKIIIVTIYAIIGMVIGATIYKVYLYHNDNLKKVVEKEFLFYAKNCYNEDKCSDVVYLKELYENKYLEDKLTDPLTKKYYSEESYVKVDTKEVVLIS